MPENGSRTPVPSATDNLAPARAEAPVACVAPGAERPPAAAKLTPEEVRASLRYSIKDGAAWSVMVGAGERYVQPFVILGGSSALALAAISALPGLAGAAVQWLAANVTDAVGRRQAIFTWCARLQATMWLPMCVAIFLPPPAGYVVLLLAFAVYVALHNFGIPAWNSLMGDLVPPDTRGRYFGVRNLIVGSSILVVFLSAGWWLAYCERTPGLGRLGLASRNFGFLTLFALAGLARLLSAWYLSRMREPHYARQPSDRFSMLDFIRRAPRANFGRFVIYCMLLHFGGGVVGPFFGWYILHELGFSTANFATIGTVHMIVYFGCQPSWGRLADRIGNKRVLTIGGLGIIGIPIILMVSDNIWYLHLVQVYDGLVWSGFNIAATNYLFDIVTPAKRARCTAYNTVFITTGAALGTLVGALIIELSPLPWTLFGVTIRHPFTLVLIVSAVLRLVPNLLLLRSFEEWRLRRPVPAQPIRPEGHGEGPPT